MTDADALLQAVLADPDRDDVRLVYADFLEEHGEPARAEFVRVQLALAACRDCRSPVTGRVVSESSLWGRCGPCRALRRRERELWLARDEIALAGLGWEFWTAFGGTPGLEWFRRGFVESVRCPLATWLAHGSAVVRAQPVTQVDVTDKSPFLNGWSEVRGAGAFSWELPREIYRLLRGQSHGGTKRYESEAAACAALSAALCLWARRCAAAPAGAAADPPRRANRPAPGRNTRSP